MGADTRIGTLYTKEGEISMPFFGKMQNWRYSPADSCISVQHTQKMEQQSGEVHKETGLGRGEKLAFVSAHQIYDVIASQFANWRGNPSVRREMYRIVPERVGIATIFGGNRHLVPFNRGIATTSVRTGLAMTAFFQTSIFLPDRSGWAFTENLPRFLKCFVASCGRI